MLLELAAKYTTILPTSVPFHLESKLGEYCHGKLDVRSSEVELEPIETSKMEVISDAELDSMVTIPAINPYIGCVAQDSLYGWFLVFRCVGLLQGQ